MLGYFFAIVMADHQLKDWDRSKYGHGDLKALLTKITRLVTIPNAE